MNKNQSYSKEVKDFLSERTYLDLGLNFKSKVKINEETVKAFFAVLPLFFYSDENNDLLLDSDNNSFLEVCAYSFIKYLSLDAEVINNGEKLSLIIHLENNMKLYFEDKYDFNNNYSDQLFIRTMFILCGTVLDPKKGYHISFRYKDKAIMEKVAQILDKYEIYGKIAKQSSNYIFYIKDSEIIKDLLAFMGAQKYSLELIETKIEKGLRNDINRKQNFDSANIKKSIINSQKTIENIKYLSQNGTLKALPDNLQYAAKLRIENPEMSLNELCLISNEPITKSGINHRFKKINDIAEEERKKEK